MIKPLSNRDRPFLTLFDARVLGGREKGDSFPSGLTAQIFFLMTFLIHCFQVGLVTPAVLVGSSRIYVGAHYPRDVIAGTVLGSVWEILATRVDPYWLVLRF